MSALSALMARQDGPLEARFRQTKWVALLREPLESSGRILIDPPARFRWEVVEPESFVVETRDGALWAGPPGAMRRAPEMVPGAGAVLPGVFGSDARALAAAFEVTARESPGSFRLVPKDGVWARALESIELDLDPESGMPTQLVLNERGNDRTKIQIFR